MEVQAASRESDLLQALSGEPFDCVVIDFDLPPSGAPVAVDEARSLLGDTPVVFVSADDRQEVVIESLRSGAADFVPKREALEGGVLWGRIQQAIQRGKRARRERRRSQRRLCALQVAAEHDPLTGLANRRFASRLLASQRQRSDRRCTTACILIDLDHFKRINDEHGHDAGDAALRGVAEMLRLAVDPGDHLIRWGGEEFLVLKASTPVAQAWAWCERLRRRIEHPGVGRAGVMPRSASMGAVCVPTASLTEESVNQADRALYLAKALGRNRVCTDVMAAAHQTAQQAAKGEASWADRRRRLCAAGDLGEGLREQLEKHSAFVCRLALRLGQALGLEKCALGDLALAGLLHDVGKATVPEEILARPGALREHEREFLSAQGRFGAELCLALGAPRTVVDTVAAYHHRGPGGQRSELAEILAVADTYAAMTSQRPYAQPSSPPEALAELRLHRGTRYAPDVVDTLHFIRGGLVEVEA
jgi:diguanylate cyclase (GGDEF)-like protein